MKSTLKKDLFNILMLLLLSTCALAACASTGKSASLAGTTWKLVSYGPLGAQIPAAAGIQTHVDFGQAGEIGGNVGCNVFGGGYQVKKGRIIFTDMHMTMMACPEPQMGQESVVLQVLSGTVRFELQGNSLVIFGEDGTSAITLSM
jgi:heat shock protein HslJ